MKNLLSIFLFLTYCVTVNAQANAAWPFGAGYQSITYLHITKGNTFHIPCGAEADFDTIQIDRGGTLVIDDFTGHGNPWTIIGCKGPFILNGIIVVQNMNRDYAVNKKWQLIEPDSTGKLSIPYFSYIIRQSIGGDGGNGSTGSSAYPAPGGLQYNGNGGGGGGTGFLKCCPTQTDTGGDANDTMSGFGGGIRSLEPNQFSKTPGVKLYGNSGDNQYTITGSSGGTRGKNGGLLFIKAMHSVTGKGTINASGTDGGNGGRVSSREGDRYANIRSGGAGGGGAGGSGGYVYIKYAGPEPTITLKVDAGAAGEGGQADFEGRMINQDGNDGQPGRPGKYLFDPIK